MISKVSFNASQVLISSFWNLYRPISLLAKIKIRILLDVKRTKLSKKSYHANNDIFFVRVDVRPVSGHPVGLECLLHVGQLRAVHGRRG